MQRLARKLGDIFGGYLLAAAETEALPAGMEALMEVEAKGVVPAAGLAAGTLYRRHEILYCST